LDDLEETIIACAEMTDIRGDADGPVEANVIESKVAKGKG
jgi:translation initiation factor IF-2